MRIGRRLFVALVAWLLPIAAAAQTYTIAPDPFLTVFNNSGAKISGACVWTYTAGTSTPATTYTSSSGTPNTNPIIADSAGRYTAYLQPGTSYKFVYENTPCSAISHGTVLRTADNISGTPTSAATVDIATAMAGETISAGQCAYLSDGSGGKTAGQWYRCDSANTYSSTTSDVGFAIAAISSGTTGTIRRAGSLTGLSSLTVGAIYYAGTAGAITTTAPTNARKVGQADTATSLIVGDPPVTALSGTTITSPTFATSILGPFFTGCGVRLTLTSGTPVTVSDVTAAATIFATPYSAGGFGAGVCAFYDGSAAWTTLAFAETSIPLGTLTSGLPYDVFCYNNSGTMACELLAWANTTTRATALVLQNGILVKTGATTRRYIGTFYTTSTTTTEDSATKRYVWNYYNRVRRQLLRVESTASWAYTTATWRQANAAAANQVEMVIGWQEALLDLRVSAGAQNTSASVTVWTGIGEDSTSSPMTTVIGGLGQSAVGGTGVNPMTVLLSKYPAVGRHVYAWLEDSTATGTTTWFGVNNTIPNGLTGWIEG